MSIYWMPGTFLSTLSPSVYSQRNRKSKRERYFNQTLSFPNSKGITSLNSTHLLGPTILEGNLSKTCQAHAKTGLIIFPAKPAPIRVSSHLVNGHLICPVIKVIQQRHHCHWLVRPCLSPTGGSSRPPSLPQTLLSIPIATTSIQASSSPTWTLIPVSSQPSRFSPLVCSPNGPRRSFYTQSWSCLSPVHSPCNAFRTIPQLFNLSLEPLSFISA